MFFGKGDSWVFLAIRSTVSSSCQAHLVTWLFYDLQVADLRNGQYSQKYWESAFINRVRWPVWVQAIGVDPSQTSPTTSGELSLSMVLTWMPEVVKYGISNLTLIGGCERHQDQPKTKVRLRSIKYKIVLKSTKCMVRLKLSRKGWRLTLPSLSSPTTEGRPKWALIRYSCHWLQCHWVTKMCSKWKSSLFLRGRTWWSKSLHSAQGHTCNGLKSKIYRNHLQ